MASTAKTPTNGYTPCCWILLITKPLAKLRKQYFLYRTGAAESVWQTPPDGVFGLWSNDPPDAEFTGFLESVLQSSGSHLVTFPNPYTGGESANTVYLASKNK